MFTRLRLSFKVLVSATRRTHCTKILSEQADTIRVRFAPSPTGYMHLGGLRTALYNYLFARAKNGKFILRIEDTDQKRIVSGAAVQLERDLEWAGIPPDESPLQGGSFGPYTQSQRVHLYKEPIKKLLDTGAAYRCFCTEEHLALRRREMLKMQSIPRYDNRCREISQGESEQRASAGEPHTIRFKLADGPLTFEDIVFGPITIDLASREGDFVIVKSDGIPTYHLACVLDDHLMHISHVLRGLEWQVSTPKHIQIYQALGWKPPLFAHLPLLVNSDGSKLSKRQADLHCGNFRSGGVLPQVLLSFVSDIGGGFRRDKDKVKLAVQPLPDLIQQFDITLIGTNPGRIDMTRLEKLNHSALQDHLSNAECRKQLAVYTQQLLKDHFKDRLSEDSEQLSLEYIDNVLRYAAPRLSRLATLLIPEHEFIWFAPDHMTLLRLFPKKRKVYAILGRTIPVVEDIVSAPIEEARENIIQKLKQFCEEKHLYYPIVMSTLRVSITGSKSSPSVGETLDLLGPDEMVKRLQFALQVFSEHQDAPEEVEERA